MRFARPSSSRPRHVDLWSLRRVVQVAAMMGVMMITLNDVELPKMKLDNKPLEMAWLMSYPNSGTTYTLALVSDLTQTHTASVYSKESERSGGEPLVPVFPDDPVSPYWVQSSNPNATFPTRYVLTKTHCGNRKNHVAPEPFLKGCRTTMVTAGPGHRHMGPHSVEPLRKAIHLIRDPFDNIVSRFRFERRHPEYSSYEATPEGFREFCENHDYDRTLDLELDLYREQWEMLKDVPCRMELIRYLQWHNMAFRTTRTLGLETMVLHYDSYTTDFDGTVERILNFLELPKRASPTPFIDGKLYSDYFTAKEKRLVKKVYDSMASTEAKKELDVYFQSIS